MSKLVLAGMAAHLQQESTTLATMWRLTRTDGAMFHFTEHDRSLEFDLDGSGLATYKPRASFNRSAIKSAVGLSVDNLDLAGVLDDADIREDDLRLGLFDKAVVHIFLVNWRDLSLGPIRLRRGTLGEVEVGEGGFYKAELRGVTQEVAQQGIVREYTVDCDADLGDSRCKIPIFPAQVQRLTAYAIGDFVRASNSNFVGLTVVNGDAETGDTTGWTLETGTLVVRGASPAPAQGANYFYGGSSAETTASQDLTVPVSLEAKIDAGDCDVRMKWLQNSLDEATDDQAEMQVDFLDGAGGQIGGTEAAGLQAPIVWTQRQFETAVPPGTRTLRVRQRMLRQTGVDNDGLIDVVQVDLVNTVPLSDDFDDRIYAVTVAGTTGVVQPLYDDTVGLFTVDGSVTFQAEEAWSRTIEVVAVDVNEPRKRFLVSELTPNAGGPRGGFGDGWLDQGVVTWESGANAGTSIEVRNFTADDGVTIEQELILALDVAFDIQVGDRGRAYPGCDKRKATCIAKFANLNNFRGFSFIPGPDTLTEFPDAKS